MSSQPEARPSEAPLQFDHAMHADPSAAPALQCARCMKPIGDAYYHDGDTTLCAGCGETRQQMAAPDRSAATLVRAAALGVGAAILGALLYYGVMEYLGLEIGIVAIAIGWLVGRAVAKATRGRSSRRHQMLALGLTYFAVALAYAPFAVKELRSGAKAAKVAADSAAKAAPTAPAAPAAGSTKSTDAPTAGGLAVALVVVSGLLLFLPIMAALSSMPAGLLSILIIGFGLLQAWTIAVASNVVVTGPHAIGSAAAA